VGCVCVVLWWCGKFDVFYSGVEAVCVRCCGGVVGYDRSIIVVW
jgi:hypothetical protein